MPELTCELCNIKVKCMTDYNRHLQTKKHEKKHQIKQHQIKTDQTNVSIEESIFYCETCNYKTKIKCNYNTHLQSVKHILQSNNQLMCKQMQTIIDTIQPAPIQIFHIHQTRNYYHCNIDVFLNNTCQHAMTIDEFTDTIQIDYSQLEYIGEQGYLNGIAKIVNDSLIRMEMNQRPIHCSDLKRKVIHAKQNNEWVKDTDYVLTNTMIKKVSTKSQSLIYPWINERDIMRHADLLQQISMIQTEMNEMHNPDIWKRMIPKIASVVYVPKQKREPNEIENAYGM